MAKKVKMLGREAIEQKDIELKVLKIKHPEKFKRVFECAEQEICNQQQAGKRIGYWDKIDIFDRLWAEATEMEAADESK